MEKRREGGSIHGRDIRGIKNGTPRRAVFTAELNYGIGAPAGTTQISAVPLVLVPARVWMRLASIPLLAVRYFFTFSARAIASFAPALLSESGMPMTTADESACCCISKATPSRMALALLSTRALPLAN